MASGYKYENRVVGIISPSSRILRTCKILLNNLADGTHSNMRKLKILSFQ